MWHRSLHTHTSTRARTRTRTHTHTRTRIRTRTRTRTCTCTHTHAHTHTHIHTHTHAHTHTPHSPCSSRTTALPHWTPPPSLFQPIRPSSLLRLPSASPLLRWQHYYWRVRCSCVAHAASSRRTPHFRLWLAPGCLYALTPSPPLPSSLSTSLPSSILRIIPSPPQRDQRHLRSLPAGAADPGLPGLVRPAIPQCVCSCCHLLRCPSVPPPPHTVAHELQCAPQVSLRCVGHKHASGQPATWKLAFANLTGLRGHTAPPYTHVQSSQGQALMTRRSSGR